MILIRHSQKTGELTNQDLSRIRQSKTGTIVRFGSGPLSKDYQIIRDDSGDISLFRVGKRAAIRNFFLGDNDKTHGITRKLNHIIQQTKLSPRIEQSLIDQIKENPIRLLSDNNISIEECDHSKGTMIKKAYLGKRVDTLALSENALTFNFKEDSRKQSDEEVKVIHTPMTDSNIQGNRGEHIGYNHHLVGGGVDADLWLTDKQSGCSTLVVKYSDETYGMVHLRPMDGDPSMVGILDRLRYPTKDKDGCYFRKQNSKLRDEASQIVSQPGKDISAYILVQSEVLSGESIVNDVTLLGVKDNREWNFYSRMNEPANGCFTVKKLDWSPWSKWTQWNAEYS